MFQVYIKVGGNTPEVLPLQYSSILSVSIQYVITKAVHTLQIRLFLKKIKEKMHKTISVNFWKCYSFGSNTQHKKK